MMCSAHVVHPQRMHSQPSTCTASRLRAVYAVCCVPCACRVLPCVQHLEVLRLERHRRRRPLLFQRVAPRPERGVLRERVPPVLERGGEASVRLRLVGLLLHAWHDGEARPPHGPKSCWRLGEGRACRQPRPQQQMSRGRAQQARQMHGRHEDSARALLARGRKPGRLDVKRKRKQRNALLRSLVTTIQKGRPAPPSSAWPCPWRWWRPRVRRPGSASRRPSARPARSHWPSVRA